MAHKPGSSAKRVTGRAGVAQRDRIRRRDCGLCVKCGRLGHAVHHRVHLEDGGSNEDDNLEFVCADCHHIEHHGHKGCDENGNPNGGWQA